jgi:hypothetical protein
MPRAFPEAVYKQPHKLQVRSFAELVTWQAHILWTALVRLVTPFLFQLHGFKRVLARNKVQVEACEPLPGRVRHDRYYV